MIWYYIYAFGWWFALFGFGIVLLFCFDTLINNVAALFSLCVLWGCCLVYSLLLVCGFVLLLIVAGMFVCFVAVGCLFCCFVCIALRLICFVVLCL